MISNASYDKWKLQAPDDDVDRECANCFDEFGKREWVEVDDDEAPAGRRHGGYYETVEEDGQHDGLCKKCGDLASRGWVKKCVCGFWFEPEGEEPICEECIGDDKTADYARGI